MRIKLAFISVVGVMLAIIGRGEIYVAPNGAGPAPYASWETAAADIQTAVTAASAGDTVLISNGVYTLDATIDVPRNMTLRGVPTDDPPTIDGNQLVRCLSAGKNTTVVLENLRIINGLASGVHGGGASLANGGVSDCVFTNNTVTGGWGWRGGGLYMSGSGTVERTVFKHNTSHFGGGGFAANSSSYLKISDCDFQENEGGGDGGGGVRLDKAAGVTVSNCRFIGNITVNKGSGAGINAGGAPVSAAPNLITNCLFTGNTAGVVVEGIGFWGGGIYFYAAEDRDPYTVADCVITNNAAVNNGGGIAMNNGSIRNCLIAFNRQLGESNIGYGGGGVNMGGGELINCRIEGNVASYAGGGVYAQGGLIRNCLIINNVRTNSAGAFGGGGIRVREDKGLRVENCTIAGNLSNFYGGGVTLYNPAIFINTLIYSNICSQSSSYNNYYQNAGGTNTVFTNCCFTPILARSNQSLWSDCLHVDPHFEAPRYALAAKSPCINSGFLLPWMDGAYDLAGKPRIDRASKKVDMGCFEYTLSGTVLRIK